MTNALYWFVLSNTSLLVQVIWDTALVYNESFVFESCVTHSKLGLALPCRAVPWRQVILAFDVPCLVPTYDKKTLNLVLYILAPQKLGLAEIYDSVYSPNPAHTLTTDLIIIVTQHVTLGWGKLWVTCVGLRPLQPPATQVWALSESESKLSS